mmetsp:Transcript_178786/g.573017  ORF Transcript_178786/g.573017 Transcript_178786/m.573017 type:complete len:249 (+) Transcript_178786:1129-1875(+)
MPTASTKAQHMQLALVLQANCANESRRVPGSEMLDCHSPASEQRCPLLASHSRQIDHHADRHPHRGLSATCPMPECNLQCRFDDRGCHLPAHRLPQRARRLSSEYPHDRSASRTMIPRSVPLPGRWRLHQPTMTHTMPLRADCRAALSAPSMAALGRRSNLRNTWQSVPACRAEFHRSQWSTEWAHQVQVAGSRPCNLKLAPLFRGYDSGDNATLRSLHATSCKRAAPCPRLPASRGRPKVGQHASRE